MPPVFFFFFFVLWMRMILVATSWPVPPAKGRASFVDAHMHMSVHDSSEMTSIMWRLSIVV